MSKKKLFLSVAAVVLVVGLLLGLYFATRPQVQEGTKSFTVTVVHKDGSSKDFKYTSAEEFVGTVLQAEGLVEGEMGQYGLYIKKVDGEQAVYEEDGAYWGFYIGEDYAQTGIDQTPIEDGKVYKLVYVSAS